MTKKDDLVPESEINRLNRLFGGALLILFLVTGFLCLAEARGCHAPKSLPSAGVDIAP